MPTRDYVVRSLRAALLLARFDPRGMQGFDVSLTGFWRSFGAALLVMPLSAIVQMLNFPVSAHGTAWVAFVQLGEFAVGLVAFPIAMIFVARLMGWGRQYVGYIIAYNWCGVLQSALFFPISVAQATNALPDGPGQIIEFAVLIYVLLFETFVARTALQTTTTTAIGMVVLDYVVRVGLFLTSQRLL